MRMARTDTDKTIDKKTIILTGGGSAGHVIPNLLLLPDLLAGSWDVHYIGSRSGIEASLARREGVTYHSVSTGKLRRYIDIKNFFDPFRVVAGIFQSLRIILKLRPKVIFSKGGFVAVPVVLAGWFLRTPVIIHESDLTQGLANRICAPFSKRICLSFRESPGAVGASEKAKTIYTGAPVRPELGAGNAAEGYRICGFDADGGKPVLLVVGGSQGSESLNRIVRSELPELLKSWRVAHLCGRGNIDGTLRDTAGYAQIEYAAEELAHISKISRAAVSRAGSNTIFELLYLQIPSVLIPLPLNASRGDQLLNAEAFSKSGYCVKLEEKEAVAPGKLKETLSMLDADYDKFIRAMKTAEVPDSKSMILDIVYSNAKK
jgi:UDP-N-acetylglucosamine--N-acetylmuramyl-(pentapeptide) pyrophosphoryl-undecaprenol N-acetylglucosamine transferase